MCTSTHTILPWILLNKHNSICFQIKRKNLYEINAIKFTSTSTNPFFDVLWRKLPQYLPNFKLTWIIHAFDRNNNSRIPYLCLFSRLKLEIKKAHLCPWNPWFTNTFNLLILLRTFDKIKTKMRNKIKFRNRTRNKIKVTKINTLTHYPLKYGNREIKLNKNWLLIITYTFSFNPVSLLRTQFNQETENKLNKKTDYTYTITFNRISSLRTQFNSES